MCIKLFLMTPWRVATIAECAAPRVLIACTAMVAAWCGWRVLGVLLAGTL